MEHIVGYVFAALLGACVGCCIVRNKPETDKDEGFDTVLRDAEAADDFWSNDGMGGTL